MADKVSTIRFKVEGSQAATDVEKLSRTIQAQELRISRATLKAQAEDTLENQQKIYNEKAKLEQLYSDVSFAASHTRAKYELMTFDRTLRAQLEKFKTNEKAHTAIAQAGAIERAKIEQAAGGGGMGLAGFGGKMILAHAMGIAGGDILGDQHGGRELGAIAGAAMFGGPEMMAAVVALEMVGSAFRGARETTELTTKATQQYLETMDELSKKWSSIGTGQIENTSFGKAMAGLAAQSGSALQKIKAEQTATINEGESFSSYVYRLVTNTPEEQSGHSQLLQYQNLRSKMEGISQSEAHGYAKDEGYAELDARKEFLQVQKRIYDLDSMRPGLLKEEKAVRLEVSMMAKKQTEEFRHQNAQAQAAVDLTKKLAEAAEAAWKANPKNLNLLNAKNYTANEYADARIAQSKLPDQQKQQDAEDAAKAKHEWNAMLEKESRATEAQQYKTDEAVIRSQKEGYAQKTALRERAFREEELAAAAHGQVMVDLVKQQHQAMRIEDQRAAREHIDHLMATFNTEKALAQLHKEKDEWESLGATEAESAALEKNLLTGHIQIQIEEEKIQLKLAQKKITEEEAHYEEAKAKNILAQGNSPEAKRIQEKLREEAHLWEELRQAKREDTLDKLEGEVQPERYKSGEFSTKYDSHFVNFAALSPGENDVRNVGRQQIHLQQRIADLLQQIAHNGGLN